MPPAPVCCWKISARAHQISARRRARRPRNRRRRILCMNRSPNSARAWPSSESSSAANPLRAHVGVTRKLCSRHRADYRMVDRQRQAPRTHAARRTLTVKTEAGTEFAAHFRSGLDWSRQRLISPRYWSNLPAGEVSPPRPASTALSSASHRRRSLQRQYGDLHRARPGSSKSKAPASSMSSVEAQRPRRGILDYCHNRRKQ